MKLMRETKNGIKVFRTGNRFVASYPVPDDRDGKRHRAIPPLRQFVLGSYRTIDEAEHWANIGRHLHGHKVPLSGVREAMARLRASRLEDEQAKQAEAQA